MADTFRVSVHVQPGARRSAVVGWDGDVLRVRVAAPPVEGKANDALTALLAEALDVPQSSLRIHRGVRGRRKLVVVEGITQEEGRKALERPE